MAAKVIVLGAFALVSVAGLLFLFNANMTGNVTTGVCPVNSAPIISGERFLAEFEKFEAMGYRCFFGFDGITPCCSRNGLDVAQSERLIDRSSWEVHGREVYRVP